MLFKPELCQLILHGLKTQTRRLARPGDKADREMDGAIWRVTRMTKAGRHIKWMQHAMYAVQPGRGKKAVGYIVVQQIRQERLQEISDHDVRAEGFSLEVELGMDSRDGHTVVMAGADGEGMEETWDSLNRRPGTRWADNPLVWVLTFKVLK